ncbi:fungal-specific transcription factor domain-containing protein [Lipomyces arxii]|uniref:fungal-specific transcription factor domain-containing protein n=1 Tax=Lipomyces arxii TaxID=56418 RepID=UPI0034CF13C9
MRPSPSSSSLHAQGGDSSNTWQQTTGSSGGGGGVSSTTPSPAAPRKSSESPSSTTNSSISKDTSPVRHPSGSGGNAPGLELSSSNLPRLNSFNSSQFRSSSPLSVSQSVSSDVKDQIHVFRVTPTQSGRASSKQSDPAQTLQSRDQQQLQQQQQQQQLQQHKGLRAAATRRTIQACERCHKRRTKCDGKYPECSACVKASVRCQYASNRSGAVLYPRGYVTALEERVAWLERSLHDQFPGIDISETQTNTEIPFADAKADGSSSSSVPSPKRAFQEFRVGPSHYYYEAFKHPTDTLDDLAVHVGFLSLGSAGEESVAVDAPAEPRYLGSSSGIAVASIVNTVVKQLGVSLPKTSSPAELRSSYTNSASSLKSEFGDGSQADQLVPPFPPDESFWPPYDEALRLSRAGFEEIVFYPFIHSYTFMSYLNKSYDPDIMDQLRTVVGWRMTLFMICAIGSAALGEREKQRGYFAMASLPSVLDHALEKDNLRTVRLLLLLTLYSFYDPEGSSAWLTVGTSMRVAVALGLHRQSSGIHLNLINQEVRKRVFWATYSVDRVVTTLLGRPVMLSDRDIDVPYYLDIRQDPEMTGESQDSSQVLVDIPVSLHIVKLRQLASRILVSIHHDYTFAPNESTLEDLRQSLDSWRSNMPQITIAPERTRIRLDVEYHEHLMLLYRPSVSFPVPSTSAAVICANSASAAIELYAIMSTSFHLAPTFLAIRGVFTAVMTLLWAHFACQQYRLRLLSIRVILRSLETAKQYLVEGSRYWTFAERCVEVIDIFVNVITETECSDIELMTNDMSQGGDKLIVPDVDNLLAGMPFDVSFYGRSSSTSWTTTSPPTEPNQGPPSSEEYLFMSYEPDESGEVLSMGGESQQMEFMLETGRTQSNGTVGYGMGIPTQQNFRYDDFMDLA